MVSIWMSALFFTKLTIFFRFSDYARGQAIEWGVTSRDETHHHVCVDYSFVLKSKNYRARHEFFKPNYPNREAAEYGKEAMESEIVDVWINWPSKSENPRSILERAFPYNELFRMLITLAIFSYFLFLRHYFSHFSVQEGGKFSGTRR